MQLSGLRDWDQIGSHHWPENPKTLTSGPRLKAPPTTTTWLGLEAGVNPERSCLGGNQKAQGLPARGLPPSS